MTDTTAPDETLAAAPAPALAPADARAYLGVHAEGWERRLGQRAGGAG